MKWKIFSCMLFAVFGTVAYLQGQDNFVVLDVGIKYLYDVELGSGLGARRAESIERIEGKESINGREYFRTVNVISGIPGTEPDVYFQRLAADGLYVLRYVNGKPIEQLSLPLPFKIGRSWSSRFGDFQSTCRVEAHEPAILPTKTYEDAYKVACTGRMKRRHFKSYGYYVAGIGAVRYVQENGNGMVLEMRLREVGKVGA
jgi:hypothetical protein